jgi:hypothetical protein
LDAPPKRPAQYALRGIRDTAEHRACSEEGLSEAAAPIAVKLRL